ncbi:MAG: hypothetical protein K2I48_09435, partial [Muribaculaceae bacterium]|nr:hypothetical protein [Muribaculaceae bacterium]
MKKSIPLLVAIALLESATPLKASEYRGAQASIAPIESSDRLPYAALPTDEAQSNEASEESESVLRHLTLLHPAKSECNPRTTATYFGSGLGIICLGLDTSDAAPGEGEISMLYCEDSDGDYETLASVNVANEGAVNFEGTSMTSSPATTSSDDDGLPTFTPSYYMNILFAGDGTGGIVVDELQKFTRYGYYRLLIPDGAIMIEGRPTAGASILFHYTAGGSTAVDFTYSLTPEEGEVFTDVSLLGYGQLGITVEFPKATTIS